MTTPSTPSWNRWLATWGQVWAGVILVSFGVVGLVLVADGAYDGWHGAAFAIAVGTAQLGIGLFRVSRRASRENSGE